MKRENYLLAIVFVFVLCNSAFGQISISSKDSLSDRMKQIVLETSSKLFHDPTFPRFIMVDKTGKYVFGVLGYVGATVFYDGGGNQGVDFINSEIMVPGNHSELDRFGITMGYTRLGFKMIGDSPAGKIVTYIEADFKGNHNNFRLRQAYIQFRGLTVGQAWSSITDTDSPATIDGEGPPSMASSRVPQIRYEFNLPRGFSVSVAAEIPSVTATYNNEIININERFPDIPVVLTYESDKFNILGGYVARFLRYKDLEKSINRSLGHTFTLSANYKFTKKDKIYAQLIHVSGMADNIQDLSDTGLDMIVSPNGDSYNITKGFGYYIAYQRKWGKTAESNVMFSQTFLEGTGELYPNMYKRADYFAANYIRKFFTYGTAGLEFVYGTLRHINNDKGNNFRINLLIRYDF